MKKSSGSLNTQASRNAYAVSVAVALLLAAGLLGAYFAFLRPEQEGYTTIYLLDSQKKAVNYPEVVAANGSSTFSVYAVVENHLGYALNDSQVQLKIVRNANPTFPVLDANATQIFNGTIPDGEKLEHIVTVSISEPGDYLIVFELWIPNEDTGKVEFTNNFCVLNVKIPEPEPTETPAPPAIE